MFNKKASINYRRTVGLHNTISSPLFYFNFWPTNRIFVSGWSFQSWQVSTWNSLPLIQPSPLWRHARVPGSRDPQISTPGWPFQIFSKIIGWFKKIMWWLLFYNYLVWCFVICFCGLRVVHNTKLRKWMNLVLWCVALFLKYYSFTLTGYLLLFL